MPLELVERALRRAAPQPSAAKPPLRRAAAEVGGSRMEKQMPESSGSTSGLQKTASCSTGDLSNRSVPRGLTQARRLSSSSEVQSRTSPLTRATGEASNETVRTRDLRPEKPLERGLEGVEGSGLVVESLPLRSRPRPTRVTDLMLLQLFFFA